MKPAKFTSAVLAAMMLITNTGLAFPIDFAPGTPLVDALRALGYKRFKRQCIHAHG